MTHQNELHTQEIHSASLGKRMLQGGAIAFILIVLFLANAGAPDPAWPKLWMVKPLLMVPFAGALGGAYYYIMDHLREEGGWSIVLANLLSLVGYVIVLWLGVVLGLNGTMWD
jgi:hypothetical protein